MHKSFFLIIVLFLSACNGEEEIQNLDNPKLVTVAFFEALYNEKDINKAASVCSTKLARLILHYKTSQSVARHLFNMPYDKVTAVQPDDTGIKIRELFKDKALVTVYISGYFDGNLIKDAKSLSLVQNDDDQWVIDEILKDPF